MHKLPGGLWDVVFGIPLRVGELLEQFTVRKPVNVGAEERMEVVNGGLEAGTSIRFRLDLLGSRHLCCKELAGPFAALLVGHVGRPRRRRYNRQARYRLGFAKLLLEWECAIWRL